MAVISWTGSVGDQFWVDIASPINITATSATTTITLPSINLKAYSPYWGSGNRLLGLCCYYDFYYNLWKGDWHTDCVEIKNGSTIIKNNLYAHTNSYIGNNVYGSAVWDTSPTITTSTLFSSTNKNEKTVSLGLYLPDGAMSTYDKSDTGSAIYTGQEYRLSTINVTLNVPPTATLGTPIYATPQYAGLGAYTVPITSAEAYYGGDISKVTLTVGQDSTVQTYSSASISNETISVIPTIAGTYTPTITVEDSRGQTTTNTLSQIVVNPYLNPSLDFDIVRTNNNGVRDDEGAYGLITANVSFTDAIANLVQPTVKINGTTTNNVTWYSAYNASTGVSSSISDWSTVSPGDTIYGLINGSFSQTDSYQITVVLTDSLDGNSSAITQTLPTAFYTIDFKAGGKEIAFGAPANDTLTTNQEEVGLFKCNMESKFNEDAVFNSDLTAQDMTAQEIEDFMESMVVPPAVDYIVERGSSGSWTYCKWASGIAECWGIAYTGSCHPSAAWGSGGYQHFDISFPSGLFVSKPVPTVVINKHTSSGLPLASIDGVTTTFLGVFVWDAITTYTYTIDIDVHVKGRWK